MCKNCFFPLFVWNTVPFPRIWGIRNLLYIPATLYRILVRFVKNGRAIILENEFRAAFHVCSWLRECHSFDRKTTELIQLFQYTTTRSLMIFNVYVCMNNNYYAKKLNAYAILFRCVFALRKFARGQG